MKRIIVFLVAITLFMGSIFAQSFEFYRKGELLPNNAEITISELEYDEWNEMYAIQSEVELKNTTDNSIYAYLQQTVHEFPTSGKLGVCFGICSQPTNDTITFSTDVPSGDLIGFHLAFEQIEEGEYTSIKVQYDVYPENDESDKTTIIINYVYSESGICKRNLIENISVYDQNGKTCFEFDQLLPDTQLIIYNITGKEIGQYAINSKLFILPETLKKGIYIYAVKQKGKVISTGKYVQK